MAGFCPTGNRGRGGSDAFAASPSMDRMLSRLLDPRDGSVREPVLWLVLGAVAASLLLAFYVLCERQVQRANERHAASRVERIQMRECHRPDGPPEPGCARPLAQAVQFR